MKSGKLFLDIGQPPLNPATDRAMICGGAVLNCRPSPFTAAEIRMISLDTSIAFFGLSLLLGLSPGPDNLFVLIQSATGGRKVGMCVVLGLCTGLLVHTSAVVLGLAAVFAASALAFTVLKVIGSAYLLYLAWQAFRTPTSPGPVPEAAPPYLLPMYLRGILMNLTNPKVVFFFLAFLPQFVEPHRGPMGLQLAWLGFLFILATLLAFGAITWFAAAIGHWFQGSSRARQILDRIAGTVFLGLAARLALAER